MNNLPSESQIEYKCEDVIISKSEFESESRDLPLSLSLDPPDPDKNEDGASIDTFKELKGEPEEPIEEIIEETIEETTEECPEPIEELPEEPIEEPIEEQIIEPIEEPIEEPIIEPIIEPIEEPIIEPIIEPIAKPLSPPPPKPYIPTKIFKVKHLDKYDSDHNILFEYDSFSVDSFERICSGNQDNIYSHLGKYLKVDQPFFGYEILGNTFEGLIGFKDPTNPVSSSERFVILLLKTVSVLRYQDLMIGLMENNPILKKFIRGGLNFRVFQGGVDSGCMDGILTLLRDYSMMSDSIQQQVFDNIINKQSNSLIELMVRNCSHLISKMIATNLITTLVDRERCAIFGSTGITKDQILNIIELLPEDLREDSRKLLL